MYFFIFFYFVKSVLFILKFLDLNLLEIVCIVLSLVLVGDNSLVQTLRVLTSLELSFNANFYSHYSCFSSVVAEHSEQFGKTINNLLPKCVSM